MAREDVLAPGANGVSMGTMGQPARPSSGTRARVLVVDDEIVMQGLLQDILSAEGYEVVIATNGQDGLERMAALHPDLVLLDLMMPVLDGWGVLKALEGKAGVPPVIVLSASTNITGTVERAMARGAYACFPKPFDLGALLERCQEALDGRRKLS
jgi:DNA-binding response OmpR family regulator